MYAQLLVAVVLALGLVNGQVAFPGPCPSVSTQKDFNPSSYLGKWYEIEKYFTIFEANGKCVTAEYSLNDEGNVRVLNSNINILTGNVESIEGVATINQTDNAKLTVQFPSLPITNLAPYWVLGTDYENFAVVWSCGDLKIANAQFVWILARKPIIEPEILAKAHQVMDTNGINKKHLIKTNQKDCPEGH